MAVNGATSVWSGYNHQGKVGLLVALCEINRIISENGGTIPVDIESLLSQWSLKFESSREDFDVVIEVDGSESTHSRHQVKAKMNGVTESDYAKVFKPRTKTKQDGTRELVDGFDCSGVDENHRFLHVVQNIDISSWSNEYKIKLYTYPALNGQPAKQYCDFSCVNDDNDEMLELACNQLKQIFTTKTDTEIKITWKDLQYRLSARISKGHRDGGIAQFSLAELYSYCINSDIKGYECERMQRSFLEYWDDFTDEVRGNASFSEEMYTRGKKYIQDIISLSDDELLRAVRIMHPNESSEVRNMSRDGLQQVIFKVVSEVTARDYDKNCVKYEKEEVPIVLTTLHSLDEGAPGRNDVAMERILRTIAKEDVASLFVKSKVVNKSLDAPFEISSSELRSKILGGRTAYNIMDRAPLCFISARTAVTELNEQEL